MEIRYRKVKVEDAQTVLDYLDLAGKESDNLTFGEEGLGVTLDEEVAMIEKILAGDNQVMYLALDQNRIVSIANLSTSSRPRMKHVSTLGISVLKDYWHQGIATHMMKLLLDFAQQCESTEIIRLDVRSDNAYAVHLYEKFGFTKIGTFPEEMKINGDYISIDIMRLKLCS